MPPRTVIKDAAYYRDYRAKRKSAGNAVPRGARQESKFERAEFIAWDGEGFTTDECITYDSDDRGILKFPIRCNCYRHNFVLFANSMGECIQAQQQVSANSYLSSVACFDLLLSTARNYPHAIHVVYGGSYDMTHILRDLDRDTVKYLMVYGECDWQDYQIRYLPRKSLQISKHGRSVTLWDVIGFFQVPFVAAIEQWLGTDYPELELIREGKKTRVQFNDSDYGFMQRYNDAELRALVGLMEHFARSVKSLQLTLSRWDGAGAIAASIFAKNGVKNCMQASAPPMAEFAARFAYFGGRFELGQYGITEGETYGYDINSAYPTVFRDLPDLSQGVWQHDTSPDRFPDYVADFSLVRIRWNLPGIRFGPFPYRDVQGLVLFPTTGENWVWGIEYNTWRSTIPDRPDWEVEVQESWTFHATSNRKPFAFVQEYYDERQAVVNRTSPLPFGASIVLKLGLNSLYGKTAQSIGYDPDTGRKPPYHNLFYAGFVTAATRAKLWRAAMHDPDAIIMLATDGILSSRPLPVDTSTIKQIGKWEQKTYDFIAAIQSGVYITGKNGKLSFRKRGIDVSPRPGVDNENPIEYFINQVRMHWGNKTDIYEKLPISQSRLIGLKSAVTSDDMWQRRGCWYAHTHELAMQPGPSTKRVRDPLSPNRQPGKGLVLTQPTDNLIYDFQGYFSTPYERPWDVENEADYRADWAWDNAEELKEIQDGAT